MTKTADISIVPSKAECKQGVSACLLCLLFLLAVGCQKSAIQPLPTPISASGIVTQSTPTLAAYRREPTPMGGVGAEGVYRGSSSIGDPYLPRLGSSDYDVQRYRIQLTLSPSQKSIYGTTTIDAQALVDNLSYIALDFAGYHVVQVRTEGSPTGFYRDEEKLWIELPRPLSAGALFSVAVVYQGAPAPYASPYAGAAGALGMHFVSDELIYTISEPDGAHHWFPSNDHPRDKALFHFELTVPTGYAAVANGRIVDITDSGQLPLLSDSQGRTFTWEHNYPMATYLALVTVGRFEQIQSISNQGVPLNHFVTAEFRESFETMASVTGEAIDWMAQLLGPYPFETFGFAAVDMPPAAMETQTLVLLSNQLIGQRTAVHEMAHMWFGNWVTVDSWSEMWLKEGFATYLTMMWESRGNPEMLAQKIANAQASVSQNGPPYPIGNPPPQQLLSFNTYLKGALFIHTLRQEMGDEAFFTGVRKYLTRFGGKTASSGDFQSVMEAEAGRPLGDLFAEWLQ